MEVSRDQTGKDVVLNDLRKELEGMSPLSPDCCIYRVPGKVRQSNPRAYNPQLVSLGPLHHGSKKLQAMEEDKRRYLLYFLHRKHVSLDDCVKLVQDRESGLRDCYAETLVGITSHEFVKLILLDAVFVIEFCLRVFFRQEYHGDDGVTDKLRIDFSVAQDIILLENQLPFFIMEDLLELGKSKSPEVLALQQVTMVKLALSLCQVFWSFPSSTSEQGRFEQVRPAHFLGLIWLSFVPGTPASKPQGVLNMCATMVPATELHHSGVKLTVGQSKNLFCITFEGGRLTIPSLKLGKMSAILFLNLMSFEHLALADNYINDYVALLNFLIKSAEDVDLLSQRQIIQHVFEPKEVCNIVHKLYRDCLFDTEDFYFTGLVNDLNKYRSKPWRRWKATLEQNYLNNPWAAISVIAASLLLVLAFIQAVCSIITLRP